MGSILAMLAMESTPQCCRALPVPPLSPPVVWPPVWARVVSNTAGGSRGEEVDEKSNSRTLYWRCVMPTFANPCLSAL